MGKTTNFDPKKVVEQRKTEMKDITEKLEKGVQDVFGSEQFQNLLDTMAKFPHYSVNNNILIMMQKPDATLVQSYTGWKKMGRFVKKGEKGIRIFAPAPFKLEKEQEKLDEAGKVILDKDGEAVKEKVEINLTAFKPVSTFDISQTEGELLPSIGVKELTAEKEPISFYVAECGEFHSMGEFHENLTLQQAVDIYKSIPSDRMNGVKTIGFVINDDQLLANEYDLVVGNRLNMQEMKDILPDLAEHPLVVKAADEITKRLPELNGTEKDSLKDAEKEDSVSKKIKEKSKAARAKKAKTSKKKEKVAI